MLPNNHLHQSSFMCKHICVSILDKEEYLIMFHEPYSIQPCVTAIVMITKVYQMLLQDHQLQIQDNFSKLMPIKNRYFRITGTRTVLSLEFYIIIDSILFRISLGTFGSLLFINKHYLVKVLCVILV